MGVQSPKKKHGIFTKKVTFFSKNPNAPNGIKSKINLTFIFHLVEALTCAVGGWGPVFGTKS